MHTGCIKEGGRRERQAAGEPFLVMHKSRRRAKGSRPMQTGRIKERGRWGSGVRAGQGQVPAGPPKHELARV